MRPAPVVGPVGAWALASTPPEPQDRLARRHERLLEDPPPTLRGGRPNLAALLLGLLVLPWAFDARRAPDEPMPARLAGVAAMAIVWFSAWALANLILIPTLADGVAQWRETRQVRRARLSGREQLERVLQLSLARPLSGLGLEAAGQGLVTLAERHPRLPAAGWEDAWMRLLTGAIADWDHLALEWLGPPLAAFLGLRDAPLTPADGLRILEQAGRLAHFPPGGDRRRIQALDRFGQFDRLMARLAQLRPGDPLLQARGRQHLAALVAQAPFAQDLPVAMDEAFRPQRLPGSHPCQSPRRYGAGSRRPW